MNYHKTTHHKHACLTLYIFVCSAYDTNSVPIYSHIRSTQFEIEQDAIHTSVNPHYEMHHPMQASAELDLVNPSFNPTLFKAIDDMSATERDTYHFNTADTYEVLSNGLDQLTTELVQSQLYINSQFKVTHWLDNLTINRKACVRLLRYHGWNTVTTEDNNRVVMLTNRCYLTSRSIHNDD
jgi:hypothetical protein